MTRFPGDGRVVVGGGEERGLSLRRERGWLAAGAEGRRKTTEGGKEKIVALQLPTSSPQKVLLRNFETAGKAAQFQRSSRLGQETSSF